jgi:hypothetical protein
MHSVSLNCSAECVCEDGALFRRGAVMLHVKVADVQCNVVLCGFLGWLPGVSLKRENFPKAANKI